VIKRFCAAPSPAWVRTTHEVVPNVPRCTRVSFRPVLTPGRSYFFPYCVYCSIRARAERVRLGDRVVLVA